MRSTPLGMPSVPPPGHPSMHPSTTLPLPPSATPLAPPRENPLSHHVLRHGEEGGAKGGEGGHPKKMYISAHDTFGGVENPPHTPPELLLLHGGGLRGGSKWGDFKNVFHGGGLRTPMGG